MDPFFRLNHAGRETRRSPSYRWDNSERGLPGLHVIQRTTSGEGYFRSGGREWRVRPGDAMLFTHGEPSAYGYPADATAPYELEFIAFEGALAAPFFARIRTDFGPVPRMAEEGEAAGLFCDLLQRALSKQYRDRWQPSELIYQLLVAVYREQATARGASDPVEFGRQYLENHYHHPVSLKELATKAGLSREHFTRRFGQRYGESPGAFVRRLRLDRARRMLQASDCSLTEVAAACGFGSAHSLCRAYRSHFGRSPRQAR